MKTVCFLLLASEIRLSAIGSEVAVPLCASMQPFWLG